MTLTVHDPETQTPAECLQLDHAAMRVSFTWMGTRKALADAHLSEIADDFDADRKSLSASKKLFDTKHPEYRAVAKIKREITQHWKLSTLPFPEPGIRLLPRTKLEAFDAFMQDAQERLTQAVAELQEHYEELRDQARDNLGRLFNEADYPANIAHLFAVDWHTENISPPDYLLKIRPEFYDREMQRIRGQFNAAVELAEQAFAQELTGLVDKLTERMTDNEDGSPKVFGDGCVTKLREFIGRFRELSVKSNDDLEKLVDDCDNLTRGVTAAQLRDLPDIRRHVAEKLAKVKEAMEKDMTLAPRRKITRRPQPK